MYAKLSALNPAEECCRRGAERRAAKLLPRWLAGLLTGRAVLAARRNAALPSSSLESELRAALAATRFGAWGSACCSIIDCCRCHLRYGTAACERLVLQLH